MRQWGRETYRHRPLDIVLSASVPVAGEDERRVVWDTRRAVRDETYFGVKVANALVGDGMMRMMLVVVVPLVRVASLLGGVGVSVYLAVVLTVPMRVSMTMSMTLFVPAPLFALLGELYFNHHHPSSHLQHAHQPLHEPRHIVHMMHHHRHDAGIPPCSGRDEPPFRLGLGRTGLRGAALELAGGRRSESVKRVSDVRAVLWEVLGQ